MKVHTKIARKSLNYKASPKKTKKCNKSKEKNNQKRKKIKAKKKKNRQRQTAVNIGFCSYLDLGSIRTLGSGCRDGTRLKIANFE